MCPSHFSFRKPFPSLPKRVASPIPEVPSPQSRPSLPEAAGIGSGSGSSGNVKLGPAEKGAEMKDKSDFSCSHHHPRPVAVSSSSCLSQVLSLFCFYCSGSLKQRRAFPTFVCCSSNHRHDILPTTLGKKQTKIT